MRTFAGRVVVITGAGSGIGRQLAHVLTKEGAKVAAIDRDPAGLDALAEGLKGSAVATAIGDVTDHDGIKSAVADLEAKLGPADVLVANAGIWRETPATDFNAADFAAVINVDLIGVANSFEAVLPGMLQRGAGQLVAISSLASYRGLPCWAGYCAAKAGVNALCDSFRVELRPKGIAVTTICPGFIRTNIAAGIELPKNLKMLEVEDAVGRMLGAIRGRKAFFAFPRRDSVQAGISRRVPRWLGDILVAAHRRRFRGDA